MAGATVSKWVERIRAEPRNISKKLMSSANERQINNPSAWARAKRLKELGSVFTCEHCTFTATSRQQVAIHAFKAHGHQRVARQRIDTVHCPVCMQLFHTRERVICHIEEKSARCKAVVLHTFPPLPQHIVSKMDAEDAAEARQLFRKGRRRHYADALMSRLHGPLCREAFVVGISHVSLLRTQGAVITCEMIANISALPLFNRAAVAS